MKQLIKEWELFHMEHPASNDFAAFMQYLTIKHKKRMENVTGYYVDVPAGGADIAVNGESAVALNEYTGALSYLPETSTHYGLIEWDNSEEITEVLIDGNPVEVQPIINGARPTQQPK